MHCTSYSGVCPIHEEQSDRRKDKKVPQGRPRTTARTANTKSTSSHRRVNNRHHPCACKNTKQKSTPKMIHEKLFWGLIRRFQDSYWSYGMASVNSSASISAHAEVGQRAEAKGGQKRGSKPHRKQKHRVHLQSFPNFLFFIVYCTVALFPRVQPQRCAVFMMTTKKHGLEQMRRRVETRSRG